MALSNSRAQALQLRALALAERIIVVCRDMPRTDDARIVRGQLVRSATSAAANYRAACRAQSPRAFVAKLSIAIEEADEIVRILVASRRTIRARLDREARSNSQ